MSKKEATEYVKYSVYVCVCIKFLSAVRILE